MNNFLPFFSKPSIGGIYYIEFVPISDVLQFMPINNQEASLMLLELKNGKNWYAIPATFSSMELEEEEEQNPQGILFSRIVSATIAQNSLSINQELTRFIHIDLLLRIQDRMGNHYLIGSPSEPVKIRRNFSTNKVGSQPAQKLEFSQTSIRPLTYLTLPNLPQFHISSDGELIYIEALPETFSVNSNGELSVSGAAEHRYNINSQNNLKYV